MNQIRKGSIVSHKYRKTCIYCVLAKPDAKGFTTARRVKKAVGYPDAGYKSTYRVNVKDLTYIDQIEVTEDRSSKKKESCLPVGTADDIKNMPASIKEVFENLACRLSPENISCDGELSKASIERRRKEIMKIWKDYELALGFRVSECSLDA